MFSSQEPQTIKRNIVKIAIATTLFLLVLLTRSLLSYSNFTSVNPNSEKSASIFQGASIFKTRSHCPDFDDNYEACVLSQQEGRGCQWYAQCNLCTEEGQFTEDQFEEMCASKSLR